MRRNLAGSLRRHAGLTIAFALTLVLFGGGMAIAAISNVVFARGTVATPVSVEVPGVASFETEGPVDFVHAELTFQPGDATPWHRHPGPTLVTVKQGQITFTLGNCTSQVYQAGQSFVEGHPGTMGRAQNTGTIPAIVNVAYVTPAGMATTFPNLSFTCTPNAPHGGDEDHGR